MELARYGSLRVRGQNKTGSLNLASEATCQPRAPLVVLRVGLLWAGSSESSLWQLLTLLIGCDIM